jgi:CrcB protein
MVLWQKMVWLALAGAVGTLSRFGLQGLVQGGRAGFPWGTFAVNIVGTFAFGVIWSIAERHVQGPEIRLYALIGFMGAFTTFSSFMFDTGQLLEQGQYLYAAVNLAGQNVAGIVFLFLGIALGRYL